MNKETRGAKPGERRAYKKNRDDLLSSYLHVKCHQDEKAAWVRVTSGEGRRLSDWVREVLNKASEQSLKKC